MGSSQNLPRFTAAAVQAAPVLRDAPNYFDTPATLQKAVALIQEAADHGARLVVFPETWLPSFPYWTLDFGHREAFRDLWARYLESSLEVPGAETELLAAAARRAGVYLVMGINERDRVYPARMYNSILYIGPDGAVIGVHRKVCNTSSERLFHTPGDGGDNLKTVFATDIGKIGGSICGEHVQLPLVYYWIMQGIQIHCSLWPGSRGMENVSDLMTRAVCYAAGAYSVLAAAYMPDTDFPVNFYPNSSFNQPGSFRGGSGIVNPYGEYVAGPVYDAETIVYGEIDLSQNARSRYAVNLTGIYSRWDLIGLRVRQGPYLPVVETDDKSPELKELSDRISRLEDIICEIQPPGTAADVGEFEE